MDRRSRNWKCAISYEPLLAGKQFLCDFLAKHSPQFPDWNASLPDPTDAVAFFSFVPNMRQSVTNFGPKTTQECNCQGPSPLNSWSLQSPEKKRFEWEENHLGRVWVDQRRFPPDVVFLELIRTSPNFIFLIVEFLPTSL